MKPIRTFAAAAILAALTACASHGGDAARQPDSRQSSAMNQTHTAISKYSFDDRSEERRVGKECRSGWAGEP